MAEQDNVLHAYEIWSDPALRFPLDPSWGAATQAAQAATPPGWVLRSPVNFTVWWEGDESIQSLLLEFESDQDACRGIVSRYGNGKLTFEIPLLFEPPAGVDLWIKAPSNHLKDGAQALEEVIESEKPARPFCVNWQITRPRMPVRFRRGEPICTIVPMASGGLAEQLEMRQEAIPATHSLYHLTGKNSQPAETSFTIPAQPRQLRIAVYSIACNEAKHAQRWAESAQDADVRVVADTGSRDGTQGILSECGVQVHSVSINPWRFDMARNCALALVPDDIDVCVSMDLDEVLDPGWRQGIESAWQPGVTRLWHMFHFSADSEYANNRIHARHGYTWRWPIHEIACPLGTEVYGDACQGVRMQHLPDRTKSRGQYLPLLEKAAQEDPSSRMLFYLAREYYYCGKWRQGIESAGDFLAHPDAAWHAERCAAMRHASECCKQLKQYDEAERWLRRACLEAPDLREPFVELAQLHFDAGRWAQGYAATLDALNITTRATHFLVSNRNWGSWPHELAYECAHRLGLQEKAANHWQEAVRLDPENPRFRQHVPCAAA